MSGAHRIDLQQDPPLDQQAISLTTLNEDVLTIILALISTRDAWRLAKTCRSAFAIALPRHLSDVSISSLHKLTGFCAFILIEPVYRAACLRKLSITYQTIWDMRASTTTRGLVEVFRHATSLQSLEIRSLEGLLGADPSFIDMLSRLPNLQEIVFDYLSGLSSALLRRMVSRPRSISLGVISDNLDNHILDNFIECMEVLHLREATALLSCLYHDQKWLRVQTLCIYHTESVCLSRLARVFPNLRCFHFAHIRVSPDPSPQWSSLDEVSGERPIPLSCHVRRLQVHSTAITTHSGNDLAFDMLRHTSPVVLECQLNPQDVQHLAGLVRDLKYLHAVIRGDEWAREIGVQTELIAAVRALGTMSLVALSLGHISYYFLRNPSIGFIKSLVKETEKTIPTLEYVRIKVLSQQESLILDKQLDALGRR